MIHNNNNIKMSNFVVKLSSQIKKKSNVNNTVNKFMKSITCYIVS